MFSKYGKASAQTRKSHGHVDVTRPNLTKSTVSDPSDVHPAKFGASVPERGSRSHSNAKVVELKEGDTVGESL